MISWITANLGTLVVLLIVAGILTAAVISLKKRKGGCPGCSGKCGGTCCCGDAKSRKQKEKSGRA